ncbi:MAG: hypothetical protein KGI37_05445 [Alphaproteobacteria bacterium]|nr:hypothetical protein [Alphaproteobacteria bacterium]
MFAPAPDALFSTHGILPAEHGIGDIFRSAARETVIHIKKEFGKILAVAGFEIDGIVHDGLATATGIEENINAEMPGTLDGTASDAVKNAADTLGGKAGILKKDGLRHESPDILLRSLNNRLRKTMILLRLVLLRGLRNKLMMPGILLASRLLPAHVMTDIWPAFVGLGVYMGTEGLRDLGKMLTQRAQSQPAKHEHSLRNIFKKTAQADKENTIELSFALSELLREVPPVPAAIITSLYGVAMPLGQFVFNSGIFLLEHFGFRQQSLGHKRTGALIAAATRKFVNIFPWVRPALKNMMGGRLMFHAAPGLADGVLNRIPHFSSPEIDALLGGTGTCATAALFTLGAIEIVRRAAPKAAQRYPQTAARIEKSKTIVVDFGAKAAQSKRAQQIKDFAHAAGEIGKRRFMHPMARAGARIGLCEHPHKRCAGLQKHI